MKPKHSHERFFFPLAAAILLCSTVIVVRNRAKNSGILLNQSAWKASYEERDQNPPSQGPREGFWGSRLGPKIPDNELAWREHSASIPNLVEVDKDGLQYFRPQKPSKKNIL